ncbi:hypothetical protein OUZ56_004578 [Daphnia magna]|uniref:Uncharacterized protein n=1 Tax=Daphnia magna TaxID=35525 RepID=A0ABQ9YQ80_9CRUS|nr:hypothetical protein OUZ56_004578 [Daphnia magna]
MMSCSAILTAFAQQVSRPKTPPTETIVNLESDILSVAALANAYATCHNVQDLLYFRGFSSKPAHVKRGKKGAKPRTKKKGS